MVYIHTKQLRMKFEAGYIPKKKGGGCGGTCFLPTKDEWGKEPKTKSPEPLAITTASVSTR